MTAPGLAPDPVLPRRDELLDDDRVGPRVAELVARAGGTPPEGGATRLRAKYRIGESLRATFRLGTGDAARVVSARMFPPGQAAGQHARATEVARAAGAAPYDVLLDEATGTVLWVFPQDRKLGGLDRLLDPVPSARGVFGPTWTSAELVAYSPEKAATARCRGADGSVIGYAKRQLGDEGRHSLAVLHTARRGLAEDGPLLLPRPVGFVREASLACCTAAPGRPLHDLDRAAVPAASRALGAALAVLHRQAPHRLPPVTRLHPARLARGAALVGTARPDVADLAGAVADALLRRVPPPAPDVLLHGDLHPKNVLVHPGGVSLVDLDQAGPGPAAAELGSTLARLWHPRPGDAIDQVTAAAAADALLAGYGRAPAATDLRWYAAASLLLERSVRAVNRVDVDGLRELPAVLTTALAWARSLPEVAR